MKVPSLTCFSSCVPSNTPKVPTHIRLGLVSLRNFAVALAFSSPCPFPATPSISNAAWFMFALFNLSNCSLASLRLCPLFIFNKTSSIPDSTPTYKSFIPNNLITY